MHPPTFDGRGDATLAEDWIQDIEELLRVINCTDVQKVLYSAFKLTGEAKRWWISERTIREAEGTKIGAMSVHQYAARFIELSRFAAYLIPDEEKKALFERSLQRSETLLEQRKRTAPQGSQSAVDQGPWKNRNDGSSLGQKQMQVNQSNSLCKFCNRAHTGECRREMGACFRCGKTGHLIRDCPLLLTDNKKPNPHPGSQQVNQVNNQRRMGPARVFALTSEDAKNDNNEITGSVS
ncbi:hypothetical protein F2P56_008793 [Juglans regia]|uniref:Uncharacterized protein LOC108987272 n=2 Tax=Juglans regia TaxID=51240 RepID=A0A2I4E8J6_JUGRE|nr:uncharacterized protein LOC108987272 [Juglans regia]KAF5472045.1 hypothetical protein F2P56_008793 [Juglans regia]